MRYPLTAAVALSLLIGGGAATLETMTHQDNSTHCASFGTADDTYRVTASDGTVTTNYMRCDGTVYGTVHTPDGQFRVFG